MSHLVLIGDSVFDNAAYVPIGTDVEHCLRGLLPSSQLCLLAQDGSTTLDLKEQLDRVPRDATHLIISVGGNDALEHVELLATPVGSTTEAFVMLFDAVARFETNYRRAVGEARGVGKQLIVCTIYSGDFAELIDRKAVAIALAAFNDAIIRTAVDLEVQVLDLRAVCSESIDFSNKIEPSVIGGKKVAEAIVRAVSDSGPIFKGCFLT